MSALFTALAPLAERWAREARGAAEDDTRALVRLYRDVEGALFPAWLGDAGGLPPAWLRAQVRGRVEGATCLEPGFRLLRRLPDGVFVANGEVRLWLEGGRGFAPLKARVGDPVSVELPACREHARAGVVTVLSRAGAPREAAEVELRLDAPPELRLALVEGLLHEPVPGRAPFRLEIADGSTDGQVPGARLLVGRRASGRLVPWLVRFARRHRAQVGPWRGSLARALAPGLVAWACPAPGVDFVAQRCGALSLALWHATAEARPWRPEVALALVRSGASLERPWGPLPAGWG